MGSNKLNLPTYKTLVANCESAAPNLVTLVQASSSRKPRLKIPAGIVSAMRAFPRVITWIEKNRTAYEAFVTASSAEPTTATRPASRKTRAAGG